MTNQTFTFESVSSSSNVSALITVGGDEKNISITLDGSDAAINTPAKEAFEELLNDIFSSPELLLRIVEYYPDTYEWICDLFTSPYREEETN